VHWPADEKACEESYVQAQTTQADRSGSVLITGANGNLGRQLIQRAFEGTDGPRPVRAIVRSERARRTLADISNLDVAVLDYADVEALAHAAEGCDSVVHLVGIIKEGSTSSYAGAHEATCSALANAAAKAGIRRIVYLSILGSRPDADNACLASKGRAERILLESPTPTLVLRVPMVLAAGDYASRALRGQAQSRVVPLLRGGTGREQPIDANDVVNAILRGIDLPGSSDLALDLAGPESLSRRELLERCAALYDNHPRVLPVPAFFVNAFARLLEMLTANPPLTRAMVGVLDHDDDIDPGRACEQLGLSLTPLDETLAACVGPETDNP
jgi:NADH dehydrogenase